MHVRLQKLNVGFSLLEVLIALVVFSIALIGFAGAMSVAIRAGNISTARTQATLAATMLEDRMRANPQGVIDNQYTGTLSSATAAPSNDCSGGCSTSQLATYDMAVVAQFLSRSLPNGTATINCALTPPPVTVGVRPTPRGLCTVVVTWGEVTESNMRGGNTGTRLGRFDWVFNP
ncbi:type IV pilus modification protein PilV [Ahniella affigens]|uniref:Type IV pilus modification protein PilV n=1 Tax=Ahniella affigens TaxID=2021234 RepID=A0A2P1PMV2_9GAMM|nr:type IV pilus modification protein PilV [Ahniella affigens]AVP96165.1 type IV pilus modification protein PilV [Ahniella affigens]